jgi:hypothetical protein
MDATRSPKRLYGLGSCPNGRPDHRLREPTRKLRNSARRLEAKTVTLFSTSVRKVSASKERLGSGDRIGQSARPSSVLVIQFSPTLTNPVLTNEVGDASSLAQTRTGSRRRL